MFPELKYFLSSIDLAFHEEYECSKSPPVSKVTHFSEVFVAAAVFPPVRIEGVGICENGGVAVGGVKVVENAVTGRHVVVAQHLPRLILAPCFPNTAFSYDPRRACGTHAYTR